METAGSAAFALDLPIGSHPDGYETWAHPDLWPRRWRSGAPPDALFNEGQNWGFPPQLPGEAERTGFALWRQLVAQCRQYASMLRIDHILGVHRLWWVPDGMSARDGVYVRYPRQALASVIAAEAQLTNTTVVGEDLGTVPQEIIDLLDEWELLGMHAEQFDPTEHAARHPGPTRRRPAHPRHAGVRRAVQPRRHELERLPPAARDEPRPAGARHRRRAARRRARPGWRRPTPTGDRPTSTT